MPEQATVMRIPRGLIVADLAAAACVVAGLVLRQSPSLAASLRLPPGTDLLLLGIGAAGVGVCGLLFGRRLLASRFPR